MTDLNCIAAGLIRLLSPVLLLIFWHKRTRARVLPAAVALAACFPVFIFGNFIRSGFARDSLWFYVEQGLLFGVLEEGAKFLIMRFALTDYDDRRDAVTYGIGHSAYEEVGAGLTCFGLIGEGTAASTIVLSGLWTVIEGTASCAAACIMILYGIRMGKSGIMLPLAIGFHAVGSAVLGIFIEPVAVILASLLTAAQWVIAYRCWQAMKLSHDDEE